MHPGKTKITLFVLVIVIATLIFSMYIMPLIAEAINPNASSVCERETDSKMSSTSSPTTWLKSCINCCTNEFNNNAKQMRVCVEKCSDSVTI